MAPIYIMINQKETGRNILSLMHRQGLRVRDVQEACGFENPQAVYKWLHGQSLPSIDNLLILAKLFDSTVEGVLATSEDALPRLRVRPHGSVLCCLLHAGVSALPTGMNNVFPTIPLISLPNHEQCSSTDPAINTVHCSNLPG